MSGSTINMVKYYWHAKNRPETKELMAQFISLAYQTATDREIYPKAVLIR